MGEKNTVDVLFKRDTLENIKNTPLKDGQVLWTIDQEGNDKIYNDVRQSDDTIKRTQIGGTIQVDQDFDKESPYPLANKKIVNGLKDFIPAYAKDLDVLTDALLISTTTSDDFGLNKTQLVVSGTTTNMPEDCQDGVREVGKKSNNVTYVKIFGRDKYGVSTEWLNSWNGTSWLGWARVITNIDRFIGYDNTIDGIQYSTKINKPIGSESDIAFEISRGQNKQAYLDYSGNALFSTISIKGADNSSKVVINSNRDINANNIISDNSLSAQNGVINNLTVTNSLISHGIIVAYNGISFGTSTIINSGNDLKLNSLSGDIRIQAAGATEVVIWDDPPGSVEGADGGGVLSPYGDAIMKLGTTNHSWQSIYCKGTIYYVSLSQVSDKKEKTHIAYLKDENKLDEFYMNLKPVEYKWKDNGHRTHLGFYAQDIAENAKNTIGDLSMYQARQVEIDEKGRDIEKPYSADIAEKDLRWTLSYDELIAPTVAMVQKQQKEIEELKQQIENLKR